MLNLSEDERLFVTWAQGLQVDEYIALLDAILSGDSNVLFRLFYRHADDLKEVSIAKGLNQKQRIAA